MKRLIFLKILESIRLPLSTFTRGCGLKCQRAKQSSAREKSAHQPILKEQISPLQRLTASISDQNITRKFAGELDESPWLKNRRWRTTEFHKKIIVILALIVFSMVGCAQQGGTGRETWDSDFDNNITLCAGLWNNTFLAVDLNNPSQISLDIWLSQEANADGSHVLRETRIYKGTETTVHKQYKLESISKDEKVIVRVKGPHGIIIKRNLK